MTTMFHARLYDRFIDTEQPHERKKLHGTNQGSNFLGGSFSNRGNVRATIRIRRGRQHQPLMYPEFFGQTSTHIKPMKAPSWLVLSRKILKIFASR